MLPSGPLTTRHRFRVEDYQRMVEAGILRPGDRTELIDGEILDVTPIGRRHAAMVNRLDRLFQRALGDRAIVAVQNPIVLDEYSEPQPDIAILLPRPDFYESDLPSPGDVLLLIEIADSSAKPDREQKIPRYAHAGVAEAWLVDLDQQNVRIYSESSPGGYRIVTVSRPGEIISPQAFPDVTIAVADLFGAANRS